MPISDCEVRDPRIRRTRQLLQSALQTLMLSKSFDEISVQDIAETATVNRATFYDHYTDKSALFEAIVAGAFHTLLHERNVRDEATCTSSASALILAVCDYLEESHASHAGCHGQSTCGPLMDNAIISAVRRFLIEGMSKEKDLVSGQSPEMIASTVSWAIYGAAKEWLNTPERPSAQEIAPVILQLVLPVFHAMDAKEDKDSVSVSIPSR